MIDIPAIIPVIAIIGRPNVGKSTLFNCLTRSKDALVANLPGVTRDRLYGEGEAEGKRYIVIDTGGIVPENDPFMQLMSKQIDFAIEEADVILFVVDAKTGLTPQDTTIALKLRGKGKSIFVVINKAEGIAPDIAKTDFYQLGLSQMNVIASAHRQGITTLLTDVLSSLPEQVTPIESKDEASTIKIAFVGRPNVGKSTLINRILGEERVLVYDEPGTTRDSIFIPFERQSVSFTLIDTAGVRRRTKITDAVEKFSVIKTLQAIDVANVVIFLFDARMGLSDQDLRLLDFTMEAGKALVIAINKWDGLSSEARLHIKNEIDRRLEFVAFARKHFISALHGTGVGELFKSMTEAYTSATRKIPTQRLTTILQAAVAQHQPPLVHGRRIKLRYVHPGGYNPPVFIIHGNQTESVPTDYLRYLINYFRKRLKLVGTPIRIVFKSGENPFKDRKNILTPRQRLKKQRQRAYTKRK